MSQTFKTSLSNHQLVRDLTKKFEATYENIVAQFAIVYSISQNRQFNIEDAKDSGGKEYKESQLGGHRYYLLVSLICQHYNLYKTDAQIPKLIKIHLDDGLELMKEFFDYNPTFSGFDFLLDQIETGLYGVGENPLFNLNNSGNVSENLYVKSHCINPIKIKVGTDIETKSEVFLTLNDTSKYNNCHIAVAGSSGTGKTQFAFNLLSRIVKESKQEVKFIYLDFKGLDGTLSNNQKSFFEETGCELIRLPDKPFPVNPLSAIDLINISNQKTGIRNFVDTLQEYGKLGANQYNELLKATRECFASKKHKTPTLKEIYEQILQNYTKTDSLIKLMEELTEQEIFSDNLKGANLFDRNTYISLSTNFSTSIKTISVFLIINYIFLSFMKMPDTPDQNGIKGIRYILLIDEAHVIFKERKSQQLLDTILRMIRSRGVSVMLFSQGITEFNQAEFDFSSNCNIAFLLDTKDKINLKAVYKFLGFSDKDRNILSKSLSSIQKYQALTNLKELETGKLIHL